MTRSWEDKGGLDVSPPLTRAASARLLGLLVPETGGEYRDREATKAQAYLGGRYVLFALAVPRAGVRAGLGDGPLPILRPFAHPRRPRSSGRS